MQSSLFCRHTRSGFPPWHFCITHLSNMSRFNFLLPLWPMPVDMDLTAPRMDLYGLVWTCSSYGHVFEMACLCIWSWLPPGASHQNARLQMTKDAFGGSRVIHGQKWPIGDEISQKLDLYPDRLKSGVLCRPRPHIWGSPTPKFLKYFSLEVFPRLHTSRYKHTSVRTRPVRSEECIRLDSGWPQ